MNAYVLRMTPEQEAALHVHLFQNSLEQAAFLFARLSLERKVGVFTVEDMYFVPPNGWAYQSRIHLELNDEERARVMLRARRSGLALVDVHSHPRERGGVAFSPSDVHGITEFAPYVHWKLDGRPYIAMVWAPTTVDGVVWTPGVAEPLTLAGVQVPTGTRPWYQCVGSWFKEECDE